MTERCEELDLFFDRELEPEAAQMFREHLAACKRCQEVLLGRMLEAAVVMGDAGTRSPSEPAPPPVAPAAAVLPARAAPIAAAWPTAVPAPSAAPAAATRPSAAVCAPESITAAQATAAAEPSPVTAASLAAAAPEAQPITRVPPAATAAPEAQPVTAVSVPTAPVAALDARAKRSRWPMMAAAAASGVLAAAIVLWVPCPLHRCAATVSLATTVSLAPERTSDVRFSAAALDQHRPRAAILRAAGEAPTEQIRFQELTDLERAGAHNALVGALALNGDLASAKRTARQLPDSAASLVDRAALELMAIDHTAPPVSEPVQEAAAARALSLTASALRLEPGNAQAKWNQAIALDRLGLSLTAARVLDEVAALREPGWSEEARVTAERLRRRYQGEVDDWSQLTRDADRMVAGGPVLTDRAVAQAPSLARDRFYLAVASAATAERLDALAPLARALDAQFATTALGDLLGRVRASDLRVRAPLAAELRDFLQQHEPPEALNGLRARATQHGVRDIALASFLAVGEDTTEDDDLALLDRLLTGNGDSWWKLVAAAHRAYVMEFWHRDYPAVDAIARQAAPICAETRSAWCGRITLFAGGASGQMGRADLANEQITAALRQARAAAAPVHEIAALDALGQAIAIRIAEDVDTSAIAGAYLEEVALRRPTCTTRLHRLDFAATTALQRHRFDQAAGFRREADALERGECRDAPLRLNGETARLQLVLSGRDRVETLRDQLARLEAGHQAHQRLYLDFLGSAAMLVEDRARGEAGLHLVIAAADAHPEATHAALVRALAFDALVESAAAAGSASTVLALLGERLGAPRFDRCALGVASWNQLVVAAFDAGGRSALETREIRDGAVMVPPAEVVSPAMHRRLAGCQRIDVVAPGPYLGAPRLLGDDVAWVYHTGALRPPRAPRGPARREVVVSQVSPPEALHLPPLQAFSGGPGADVLSGARATPSNVLAAMATASLAIIVAHGLTDANEPRAASLILSPDARGDYLLTAAKVRAATLTGAPIVILAGCDAGRVQVSAEPWSLATSFLAAGARAVIAPTEPIPDTSAGEVFPSLVERIRAGADPVDAIGAERQARGGAAPWLSSIVVFE